MKKFVSGLLVGLALSFCTAAYASSTFQDYLFSAKFIFNHIPVPHDSEYSTINYNGHVYVPIRFVAENMAADIEYDGRSKEIHIKQSNVKFDDYTKAPVPFVYYDNQSETGLKWMQEIPLIQGSACWLSCIDTSRISSFLEYFDVDPTRVKPESNIIISYPKEMKPDILNASILIEEETSYQTVPLTLVDQRLTVPKEAGKYLIWIKSIWSAGDTSYYFYIEVI
ncbi:stalk domain-containing protein [Paenibacillus sp. NPDC056579]|uniref:stalk domain-containing protein n=1 Tax=Paenibacillus sp. NPDC056579 TaxID=3345871 RepID=UPI0036AF24BA